MRKGIFIITAALALMIEATAQESLPYPVIRRFDPEDLLVRQHLESIRSDVPSGPLLLLGYRVGPGDSVDTIARLFELTVDSIVTLNRTNGRALRSGEIVLIPNQSGLFVAVTPRSPLERALQRRVPGASTAARVRVSLPGNEDVAFLFLPEERLTAAERRVASPQFALPVPWLGVTSPFGTRRDPITGNRAFHRGVDLAVPHGTAVRASRAGTVRSIDREQILGLSITLVHGDGFVTRYAHLREVLVKPGDVVRQGDAIARSGSTGYSTGAHLHFEIVLDGTPLDPLDFLLVEVDP